MTRTVLIGLDGATFTILDPFMERGIMPVLRRLCARGVRAPLRTILPPLTPPAWTSLMTGKRPGQHGVFDFFQKEAEGSEYFRLSTSQDIRTETIWSLASEHDRRVICLNFPVMFPPPPVNGAVVPGGWMPWRQLRLGCHPPGLFDRLKTLPSFNPRELSLDMQLEAKAIEGCPDDEHVEWIQLHIRREERWLEILRYLVQEEPAELVAVMFDGVDKLQHLCWRFIDPACQPKEPSPWEREVIDLCENYFRRLDAMIGEIVELTGPDATLIFASDHGFGPTWDVFYVNTWLAKQGYLAWADGRVARAVADAPQVGFASMTRHIFELDWNKTLAYAATPSSQGLHIVTREPGTDRPMARKRYDAVRKELAEGLRRLRNPHTGDPLILDVLTREKVFAGPHQQLAPDLSFVLADGAAVSILQSDDVVRRRTQPNGNHRWHGIFLATGPYIRSDTELAELSIVDIAPLILYSLDVPVPDGFAGRLPAEVLVPGQLERQPMRTAHTVRPVPVGVSTAIELDGDEEATVMNRLRALGYVE